MSDDDWDVVYAFFINAYHLGDWMIVDGVATKEEWHRFVSDHFELGLCRDLCNGVKHRRLNQPASVDPSPWTRREYVPVAPDGGERWHVQAGDEKHFYLMTELLDSIHFLLTCWASGKQ
jgi:hypothetical protein